MVGGLEWVLEIAPVGIQGKMAGGCRMAVHSVGSVLVEFAGSGWGEGELLGLEVEDCFILRNNATVPVL